MPLHLLFALHDSLTSGKVAHVSSRLISIVCSRTCSMAQTSSIKMLLDRFFARYSWINVPHSSIFKGLSDSFNMHNWYLCTAAESCRFRSASCTLPCQEILKTLRTTMLCLWRRTTLLLVCGRTFWTKSTPNTHDSRHRRVLVFSLYFLGMVPILKTRIAVSLLWSSTSKKHRFWIKIWSLRST